jgi:hypothetical protein
MLLQSYAKGVLSAAPTGSDDGVATDHVVESS